ncbi:MAG TPA: FHA domain-containing protein [Polyangiaceae bacterium]|nr:FHA domain-containing protein [Polyangiaceae bacterium]
MKRVAELRVPEAAAELEAIAVPVLLVGLNGAARAAAAEFRTATRDAARALPSLQDVVLDETFVAPLIKSGRNPYENFIFVGRASTCDVVLRDPSVSKTHAVLEHDPAAAPHAGWRIRDNGSHNGTWVNSRKLTARDPVPITGGDAIVLGAYPAYVILPDALRRILAGMGPPHA